MPEYIYQYSNWPHFTWQEQEIQLLLGKVRHLQGKLSGLMVAMGFTIAAETLVSRQAPGILKSAETGGELHSRELVRASVARRLGMGYAGMVVSEREVDGVAGIMMDATGNYNLPLKEERLFGWHAALFPEGRSGIRKTGAGRYRTGEMQVVSGETGTETIHFQAHPPDRVKPEMDGFLSWFNAATTTDLVVKAAIAHLWFVTIHPFNDGNGRIARAVSDVLLARSEESARRFYCLSNQIFAERDLYYEKLHTAQHGSGDITEWLDWFLNCLCRSVESTNETMQVVLAKADFQDQ